MSNGSARHGVGKVVAAMSIAQMALGPRCVADSLESGTVNRDMPVDVDWAQYHGPGRYRIFMRVNDAPRQVTAGPEWAACMQLRARDNGDIVVRILRLKPTFGEVEEIRIGGAAIFPGTFRTTSWGLLLRLVVPPWLPGRGALGLDGEIEAEQMQICDL